MTKDEFEKALTLYESDIYTLCLHLTQNIHSAEDLFQETFLELFKKVEKLDETRNLKSYFVGAVYYTYKSKYRKLKRRMSIAGECLGTDIEGDREKERKTEIDDLEQSVIKRVEYEQLINEVNNLKDSYRVIIEMYYSLDMTTKEISEALKIPKGTVESRLHRARGILKKNMEGLGYDR